MSTEPAAAHQSEVDVGTSVTMYLPKFDGDASLENEAVALFTAPEQQGVGETILVVEDEPSIREMMAEVLVDLGYVVLHAKDGGQAIKILQTNRSVALVVTDVGLPGGISGRHVADVARSLKPQQRVLFITGYAASSAIGSEQLPDGVQLMTKPFELRAFGQRVQSLLRS